MDTLAPHIAAPSVDAIKPSFRRDLLVVIAVAVSTFLVASLLQLNERVLEFTRPFEAYQVDELPVTFVAVIVALAWFSWRRSRQALEQLNLRLAAQQALVTRDEQYRLLFMENLSGNVLARADGEIRLCNPAAVRLLGLADGTRLEGLRIGDFFADPQRWNVHREALLGGGTIELPSLDLKRRDAQPIQVVARLCMTADPVRGRELHLYMTDITELSRTQRDLANALSENRLLSQRYLQAQEEERRYLARELHDELGQNLNAIKVDAVTIRDRSHEMPEIRRSAQAIVDVSSQVYDLVRSLTRQLRPVALDELGLSSAVQYLVEQWQRRHSDVRCAFHSNSELAGMGEAVNITVYRLVQECLTNITRHALASGVEIRIDRRDARSGAEIAVTVKDDGRGFDLLAHRAGLGLLGLRERVEALGGRFEVTSAPGLGTCVSAAIPLGGKT
ncbi:MAG: ATP-binding protein [Burkholderiales bacterium]